MWATKAPVATKANMAVYIAGSLAARWAVEQLPFMRKSSSQCSDELAYSGQFFSSALSLMVFKASKTASFNGQCVAHGVIPSLVATSGFFAGTDFFDKFLTSIRNFVCWGCLPHLGGLAAVLLKIRILR